MRTSLDAAILVGVLDMHETQVVNGETGQKGVQLRLVAVMMRQVFIAGSIAWVDKGKRFDLLAPARPYVCPVIGHFAIVTGDDGDVEPPTGPDDASYPGQYPPHPIHRGVVDDVVGEQAVKGLVGERERPHLVARRGCAQPFAGQPRGAGRQARGGDVSRGDGKAQAGQGNRVPPGPTAQIERPATAFLPQPLPPGHNGPLRRAPVRGQSIEVGPDGFPTPWLFRRCHKRDRCKRSTKAGPGRRLA